MANSDLLYKAWQQRLNSPQCSSMGRLFDAAAAITGVCMQASFEGQAPMLLESLARQVAVDDSINISLTQDQDGVWRSDWAPLLTWLLEQQRSPGERAAIFHRSLAEHILQQCQQFANEHGEFAVGLAGGVFQNRLLSETTVSLLTGAGFRVYLAEQVPCNDGGLCFGQIIEQAYRDNLVVKN